MILLILALIGGTPAERVAETERPQLRYTQCHGWANDPNGLSYWNGEWHLFHQYNPDDIKWGNMHWNHAVSKDLVHWQELGPVLKPDSLGMMFSGCAVTDVNNTAGFGYNAQVLVYTAAKVSDCQCLAYSVDGRSYCKYGGNPVIPKFAEGNRDPKVFWHKPSKKWIMTLYAEDEGYHSVVFFSSSDLKNWERLSVFHGGKIADHDMWLYECPGLEELLIEGEDRKAWVLWGADDRYAVGKFDGVKFTAEEERIKGNAYIGRTSPFLAAQTFNGVSDGRCIWVAWFLQPYHEGTNYRHTFSLPQELSLKRTAEGLRLVRRPIRELETLRKGPAVDIADNSAELVEICLQAVLENSAILEMDIRGISFVYNAANGDLTIGGTKVKWQTKGGQLDMRMYLDRTSLEIFSGDGLQMAPFGSVKPKFGCTTIAVTKRSGVKDIQAKAYPLQSIWESSVRRPSEFHAVETRAHVGVPSIAVSPINGRMWAVWYGGKYRGEDMFNYVSLVTSIDGGKHWKEVLVADPDEEGPKRAFDSELWIAPDGKLRWTWTERMCDPKKGDSSKDYGLDIGDSNTDMLKMAILSAEDEPKLPLEIVDVGRGVMMCKPIVLGNGEWLMPLAHWYEAPSACFYASKDNGRTFELRGGVTIPKDMRKYDEHQAVELNNGDLLAFIRTKDSPPMSSVSHDGGRTWLAAVPASFKHTPSRIFFSKLSSGNLLLVKHGPINKDVGRKELMAYVSKDDGKTWEGGLMIDERERVSYPDGQQLPDGTIILIYDRDRLGAKEILFSKFTESDVLAGKNVSGKVSLRNIITTENQLH